MDRQQWHAVDASASGPLCPADPILDVALADPDSTDPAVQGSRELVRLLAAEPCLKATVIQTVGLKGYDGIAAAIVSS